jgi:hypothetical protein
VIRSVAVGTWLALAASALPPAVRAEEEPAPPVGSEERFDELLERFDAAILAAEADSSRMDVAVLEAETIAEVAAELLEEGEPGIAADLLAEALALVDSSFSPPGSSER